MDNLPRSHHGMKTKESSATEKKVTPDKQAQEWTTEYLDSFWKDCDSFEALERACKAINASIAAERGRFEEVLKSAGVTGVGQVVEIVQQLRTQLAATERKYLDMERREREANRQLAAAQAAIKLIAEASFQESEDYQAFVSGAAKGALINGTTALDSAIKEATKELQNQVDQNNDFMAFMTGELAQFSCCHEDGKHAGTSPMMWPELIACIARKAIAEATKNLRDQLADGYRMTHVAIAEATKPYVEALQCAEYAISHPESDQAFALNAVRDAIGQADALLAKEKQP